MYFTLFLATLCIFTASTEHKYTTSYGDIIIGECFIPTMFLGRPHIICTADNSREGVLSMIEALNSTLCSCSKNANAKYNRLEQIIFPNFEQPSELPMVIFRNCIYPNKTYAEVLKRINVNVNTLRKLELTELFVTPPLKATFFNGLSITALKLSYSEQSLVQPRLTKDITNYLSTLREFNLVGAELPTLPINSVLEKTILDSGRSRGALGGCSRLHHLTLTNWDVHSVNMEEGWLSTCRNLTELVMNSPSFDTVYRVLKNASSLRKLEINKLPQILYEIEIAITNALYLESVKIRKSAIFRVSIKSGLPEVADIDLSDNNLWNAHNIHDMLLHIQLVTNVTLSNNPVLNLCLEKPDLDDPWQLWMPNLQRLVATHTATSAVCFNKLDNFSLRLIDLSRCNISILDFTGLPRFNRSQLVLRLNHNTIERIPFQDTDYNKLLKNDIKTQPGELSLRELHLQGNRIKNFTVSSLPDTLKFIDLSFNHISYIDSVTATALFSLKERRVKLDGNSIVCDCQNQAFLTVLYENKDQVEDYNKLVCKEDGNPIRHVAISTLCITDQPQSILISIFLPTALAVIGLAVLATAVHFRYGEVIKIFLYARGLCLCCLKEEELDANRPFDVFVSFSHDDEEYVLNELLPLLEKEDYKTCIHMRDWIIGEWIPKQISVSINISRRTLIILSRNFVKSVWGMLEFRMAHASMLTEGRTRLIVMVLDDIVKAEDLDPELKGYLRTNTYLESSDPWFWDKLRYALPRRGQSAPERSQEVPADVARDFGPYGAIMPVAQRNFNDSEV